MTAEEFLNSLPHLTDGVLQQDYFKQSELHETIASAMKLLEDKEQAIRLIDLAFKVNPNLAARLAGAATSSVEQVVSQRFKAWVEDRTWREYYGINLKLDLLSQTLAIWVIPDLEQCLQQEYSVYEAATALTRIATQASNTNTKHEAISALLRGLENKSQRVRSIVIWKLGDVGCDRATESLLAILKNDPDWTIRNRAAEALGKINDPRAIDGLMAALEDPHEYVRSHAFTALGNLQSNKPIELLIRKLEDPDSKTRLASAVTLTRLGSDSALNLLISMLKNVDPITRWTSAEALGNIGKDEAIAPLILALHDEQIMVRKMAIIALGQIGNDIAIEPLTKILNNSDSSLGKEIILALNRITRMNGKKLPIQPLLSALKDPSSKVKKLAAQKLLLKTTYLGIFPQSLLNGLKHSSITIRIESSKLLGSMTQSDLEDLGIDLVIDALINNFLEDNSLFVRKFAARSLGQIGSERAIASLISVLQNPNEDRKLRRDTIYSLAKIGIERIFQPITIALKDPSDSVRIAAASVLSRIAGDWAIKDLVASLDDKKWQVHENSSNALEKIGGAKVEQELLNTLNNSELTTLHRRTIFSLLAKVGGKQSFDTLISLLTYPSKSIKSEAARGISLFICNRYDMEYINSAIKPLMALVNCSQALVRNAVVTALGHIAIHHQCREKDRILIVSALETATNDKNHDVRNSAIDALKKMPSHNDFDSLIQELDFSDIFARKITAIDGLGRMIYSQTITKLAKLTLTDTQISLAIEKLKQASHSSNRRISEPAKEILAHIDRSL